MSETKDNNVTITCYGKTETMDRSAALSFYTEGAAFCDGSEADRYASIVYGLKNGFTECNDEWDYE